MKFLRVLSIVIILLICSNKIIYCKDVSFTLTDRERLIKVEVEIKNIKESIKDLKESMNRQFDQLYTFLFILTGIFTTLTISVIGFAYWDRRTIIRKAKEETMAEIEKEGKVTDLIKALRELSKKEPKLASILKSFHLL